MKLLILFFCFGVCVGSCGRAESDGSHADQVAAPIAGYRCFIIRDNDGKGVGGNCVKE